MSETESKVGACQASMGTCIVSSAIGIYRDVLCEGGPRGKSS